MIPALPDLDEYAISSENGFLPSEPPLQRLPLYFEPWEVIVADLPELIRAKRIREVVHELPTLSADRLQHEREWRRAYGVLCYISHAYIWGEEKPQDRLPRCISVPFLQISDHLELPPVATYAGLCLWNWRPLDTSSPADDLDNIATLGSFTGGLDEAWFYLVSIAIEARGAPTIPLMIEAMAAVRRGDNVTVTECLTIFAQRIYDLRELLGHMYDHCSPHAFYFHIRPFLAGSKNMADAGLPNGLIYEDGSGKEEYQQYSGGSNAQSSLIQFFDIVLGVEHRPTGMKRDPSAASLAGTAPPPQHNFIQEMRKYMPGPHRRFLEHLTSVANIRDYVEANRQDKLLAFAYDESLRSLSSFRDKHMQIVSRYVIIQSQAARKKLQTLPEEKFHYFEQHSTLLPPEGRGLARAKSEGDKEKLTGTGGTNLIPFLKQSRDETMEGAQGSWSKKGTLSRFASFHARRTPTPTPPRSNSPAEFFEGGCKVNEYEDMPSARVGSVGLAAQWGESFEDFGGICHV